MLLAAAATGRHKTPMPHKTSLSTLKLTDFRNYAGVSLALDDRHVVLTGDNGSGKTNLLEAISFLSPGRGLRRAVLTDVTRVGASGGFSVFADVDGREGEVAIGRHRCRWRNGRAAAETQRNAVKSVEELTDHLSVPVADACHGRALYRGSSDRRRFLDRLVLSLDPAHGRRAADYERAMRSRNRLLSEGRFDPAWLTGIEVQMAELGIAMAAARAKCWIF